MIPQGATHKLKDGFARLDHPKYVIVSGVAGDCKEWVESASGDKFNAWAYIPRCLIQIEMYDNVTDIDNTDEDACFNAIEMRNACNESIAK